MVNIQLTLFKKQGVKISAHKKQIGRRTRTVTDIISYADTKRENVG